MPDFNKRHYETVALVLRSTEPMGALTDPAQMQWERTCLAFLNRFRADNSQFNAERFMLACQEDPMRRSLGAQRGEGGRVTAAVTAPAGRRQLERTSR